MYVCKKCVIFVRSSFVSFALLSLFKTENIQRFYASIIWKRLHNKVGSPRCDYTYDWAYAYIQRLHELRMYLSVLVLESLEISEEKKK